MTSRRSTILLEIAPALALAVFLVTISPVAASEPVDGWAYPLLVAAGLGAALLRRAPLVGFALMLACTCLYLATGQPDGPIYLTPLLGALGVVAAHPARVWAPVAAVSFAAPAAAGQGWRVSFVLGGLLWAGAAAAFAGFLRLRRVQAGEAQSRVLAEERLRIAREVHDVVGHSLAAISLQAGVAERLLDSRPVQAREAVAAIRTLSGQALDEVRCELGLLRREGAAAQLAPAHLGLDAVPGLVAALRDAGAEVELDIQDGGATVPDAVGAATLRIVQEALTNVVRHAGSAAQARVRVTRRADALEIEVVDDGLHAPQSPSPGNGLTGMRERAVALGGAFAAGSRTHGGFRVWARLPAPPS
ncbi:MAG TPA: histidine kinase [Solirubrobacteraceae bacterium]|nr:histidine kinase [Solirubrobacteraceae bacterium]